MKNKLSISENADPNYLAIVIECPEILNHPKPNVKRIGMVELFGGKVIIGKKETFKDSDVFEPVYTKGQKLVYFPVESCLSAKFLSWANLFDKPDLNQDGTTKGYFSPKGRRVKPVKLQDIPSEGFLFPVSELLQFAPDVPESEYYVGAQFDTIGEEQLSTKYIPNQKGTPGAPTEKAVKIPKWMHNTLNALPRGLKTKVYPWVYSYYNVSPSIVKDILPGQFAFHYKTPQLGINAHLVNPDDDIAISDKWHGTSAVFANVLSKSKLSLWDQVQKLLGRSIPLIEYKLIYSSRNTVKNRKDGKYTDDVWGQWAEELEDSGAVEPTISLYAEIVGYTSTGRMVQKNYDYGCQPLNNDLRVYRITKTDEEGNVTEFSTKEIIDYCEKHNLKTVPVFYQGKAKDLFNIPVDENWTKKFLEKLREVYLERDCVYCKHKVPSEGIVLKNNSRESKSVFKFKSFRFLKIESDERDAGETNMEDEQ